jgi:hypothetical protein
VKRGMRKNTWLKSLAGGVYSQHPGFKDSGKALLTPFVVSAVI